MATDRPTWAPPRPAGQLSPVADAPRPPGPGAATALRLGGALVVGSLIALGAASIVMQFFRQQTVETVPLSTGVTRVVASTDTGDIRVRAAVGAETPRLTSTLHWSLGRPTLARSVTGGTGSTGGTEQLDARCPKRLFSSGCSVDLDLVVPAGTTLKIDTETGEIWISGSTADLEAVTSTGDIRLSGVSGANVAARTSTGDVTVVAGGRDGGVQADTDTGDVRLTLTAPPRSVRAKSSAGDVTITVPAGDSYAIDGSTDVGNRLVSVPTDPASGRSITAQTSVGDVKVLVAGQ